MYRGFVGTVLSHFLSLISTLWAIFKMEFCRFQPIDVKYIRMGLYTVAGNSTLGIVRYGRSDGYKLRKTHIITLNISSILNFTITEALFLHLNKLPLMCLCFPFLNIIPLLCNVLAKDYRTKLKKSDVFIAINCVFLLLVGLIYENYYGLAFSMSYFFGYFVIGDSGYFLDTELPSVDAFQYLTCFLNFFGLYTLCY